MHKSETTSINGLKKLLETRGIKPSYQRLRILEYIIKKKDHPSVDRIYKALYRKMPTLSRTTIYNTLNLFTSKKIVSTLTILDNELRYDLVEQPHAHLLCTKCDKVYDIELDTHLFTEGYVRGHRTLETHIHFKGICKNCLKPEETIEKSS